MTPLDLPPVDPPAGEQPARSAGWLLSAAAGLAVGIGATGIGEAVAAVTGPATSPIVVLGSWAIDLSPQSLTEFAIRHFGSHDKRALLTGIYVVLAIVAALVGVIARRYPGVVMVAAIAVAAIGIAAALRPTAGLSSVWPSFFAAGFIAWMLRWLHERGESPPESAERRQFLLAVAGTALGGAGIGFASKAIIDHRYNASAARAKVVLPQPEHPLPAVSPATHPDVPGLEPFFTSNSSFYRVDTALVVPQVNPDKWKLRIHGLVDRPFEITYDELLRSGLVEHDQTLTCVSNPVGGPYCGNARWLGAPLAPLLRQAGVHADADQIVSSSTDGMTIGTPTAAVLDGREALLAIAMNGEALPIVHGFPVRMLVPGLYGYVSSTKWVTDLQLTRFSDSAAYWVQQGWSQQGPVKTASRIDVPKDGGHVDAGTVVVAGVAWATHRGVDAVEVRIDDGPWNEADLAASDTPDTWRQWSYQWPAVKGSHQVYVRATDGTGTVQTSAVQDVIPNGATGYHSISVTVR